MTKTTSIPKDENETISNKYKKLTQHQHIIKRSSMYVGSIEADTYETWVFDIESSSMQKRNATFVPGLYKIFDEIAVNSLDQIERLKQIGNKKTNHVKEISVDIDTETNSISICNSGDGLEIIKHAEHGIYIPELVFGNLLTSTNYDEDTERTIGGLNGLGAKLVNIFSTKFIVETVDANRELYYHQEFSENMTIKSEPIIKKSTKYPYTKITFTPDYAKFGLKGLNNDIVSLFYKRAYDICGLTDENIKVSLNNNKLSIKNFEKYSDLYLNGKKKTYEVVSERWKIVISYSETGFEQVSFVNGISTMKGGKHVDYVVNQLTKKLIEALQKKYKDVTFKPQHVKDNLFILINSVIVNPSFDSQTKDCLTTPITKFGSKCDLSKALITKLMSTELVERIYETATASISKSLKKTDGKKQSKIKGLPKLEDANWAGTNKSNECTLILTEGDSAASMAISGLSVVGRDKFGVFPLRGKIMNTLETNEQKIADNVEITALKKIIGLEQNKKYKTLNDLRYGSIMIMTDQDLDGSHIKGLLFNMFNSMWPSLMTQNGFITSMLTPVVKAKKNKKETIQFYNTNDYEEWKKNNNTKTWDIKYYKGLGTSTNVEAKEYFREMKQVTYMWDEETSQESLDMAFNKKRADDRKKWLYSYDKFNQLDYANTEVNYTDFINKDLIHFSNYNLERSIPSICDGLKRSTRKILYSCLKRNLVKEIRVAQLAGYVSEHAAYHHGETSLQEAIIGMAQNYVGSNNINILQPNGTFGTRLSGGKDSASPRYIHTELNPLSLYIYNKADNAILNYLDDDGFKIEPEYYMPIIPMILINGITGIGTGFSSNIPCYNPLDIVRILKEMLLAKSSEIEVKDINPWYQGFTGKIEKNKNTLTSFGIYKRLASSKIEITELPIGMWTQDYKESLEKYMEKNPKILKDYESHSTESEVKFILEFYPGTLNGLLAIDKVSGVTKLEKEFKLTSSKNLSTSNMHMYNDKGTIIKCKTALEIIRLFYDIRIRYYGLRKQSLINELEKELIFLDARIKFILDIIDNKLIISNRKKIEIEDYLKDNNYPQMDNKYEYLVKMPIYNLSYEKKEEFLKELNTKKDILVQIKITSIEDMWISDINDFEKNYKTFTKNRDKA